MKLDHLRTVSAFAVSLVLAVALACGGSSGPTTPDDDDGILRLTLSYDDIARRGVTTAGFRLSDVERVEIDLIGSTGAEEQNLPPEQDRAFLTLEAGTYLVQATAFGAGDLALFTATTQTTIVEQDTVGVTLKMVPALGSVELEVDGRTSGTIETVAGTEVPFTLTVRNKAGRGVPFSTVKVEPLDPDFGRVALSGGNVTDTQGRITGTISAPHSGTIELAVTVDDRPIASPGATTVRFTPAVSAQETRLVALQPNTGLQLANGAQPYTFTVTVRNAGGAILPGTPVTAVSERNGGPHSDVDVIAAAPGYEDGVTDEDGTFKFTVRTFTSSFLRLDEEGRLRSEGGGGEFFPTTIRIFADGIFVEERAVTFNSTVNPISGMLGVTKRFVTANGSDSSVIVVTARDLPSLGGGPAENAFVEIVNANGETLNDEIDLRPEPGFDGFRTNAQGEWRGRIRSTEKGSFFFEAKADGRSLTVTVRSVTFQ